MKKYLTGILLGFSLCLALIWAITIDDQPLVKTAAGQTIPPLGELLQNVDPALLEGIDPALLQNIDPALLQDLDADAIAELLPTLIAELDLSLSDLQGTKFLDGPIPETVKSTTISNDVLEYWRLFYASSRGISASVVTEIGPKLLAPRETDTDWILTTGDFLSAFTRATRQEVVGLTPPDSVSIAHGHMVSALNDCSLSAQYFDQGLDRLQPDDMRFALEMMNNCALQIARATDLMLEIEPTETLSATQAMTETEMAGEAGTMAAPESEPEAAMTATEEGGTEESTAEEATTEEEVPTISIQGTPLSVAPVEAICSCDGAQYACTDFASTEEAQSCYEMCLNVTNIDIHQLDTDRNGLACDEG